jgi:hypothetical protein
LSEAERPDRLVAGRLITVEDIRALAGPATPHFALQIRNRIRNLVGGLPEDHPARIEGEREIRRLDQLAFGGEDRGQQGSERPLPSLRLAEEKR